jgi:transposase
VIHSPPKVVRLTVDLHELLIQGGRKVVRDALYMPALVAMRNNPDLRAKYQAMVKAGKPPKVALTALMRKLIELANALIKADRNWVKKGA